MFTYTSSIGETMWKFSSGLLNFCTFESVPICYFQSRGGWFLELSEVNQPRNMCKIISLIPSKKNLSPKRFVWENERKYFTHFPGLSAKVRQRIFRWSRLKYSYQEPVPIFLDTKKSVIGTNRRHGLFGLCLFLVC